MVVRTNVGYAPGLGNVPGCLVWLIGLSLGGTTGYAINPARDLIPRTAHAVPAIARKGDSDWGYAAIAVAAPLVDAGLAGLLLHALPFLTLFTEGANCSEGAFCA